jgi:thiosulfate dehydrogenase
MENIDHHHKRTEVFSNAILALRSLMIALLGLFILIPFVLFYGDGVIRSIREEITARFTPVVIVEELPKEIFWSAPSIASIEDVSLRAQVEYGKELIAHTAKYLGPNGTVNNISNGMNCQNCHLDAGTKVFGNNYSAVASTYPKFRARSGSSEDIYKRVNDCFERSLNGKPLDTISREMQAIKAYIVFLGSNVEKGRKPNGSGLKELEFLDREADASKGKMVYDAKCVSCHQPNGAGQLALDGNEYTFPPLWGKNSFNDGAGLYRISNFARYIKYNMPQGATYANPLLTDEEAWDVAAYINSQDRPHIAVPKDWPDVTKKPVDHPFGPYADAFSEKQHKYGPFKPILEAQLKSTSTSTTLK